MTNLATRGSRRWLQLAVNRKPEHLLRALRDSGAIDEGVSVKWGSPLEADGFSEYRDQVALTRAGIANLRMPLLQFWPVGGPVWDALGVTSEGRPLFIEAKAHIAEAVSTPTKARVESRDLIERSLIEARKHYAPRATKPWSGYFFQYGNRLAHHYFLREVNGVPSTLVFLYFINAVDMQGPTSEKEWHGAAGVIHAVLGLPKDLRSHRVFDVFLDAGLLDSGARSAESSRV